MKGMRNKNGFTLIELIATIAIISILSVIAVFAFGKIRGSSEDKANYVSREAIMKSAVSYADEYYKDSKYWVTDENNDKETFCVPVLELVNKGLLKQDDIKNVNYNYVVLTRGYSNKAIINEEYDSQGICSGSTDGKAKLQIDMVTTSSATIKASCDNNGFLNYTYGLFDGNNEIKNYISKDNTYKFSGLISNKKYTFKAKCNYQNSYSSDYAELEKIIGYTDLSFKTGNVKNDKSNNKIYKEVIINYVANNIQPSGNAKYYFKVNSSDNISNQVVYACGNDSSPSSTCDSNGVTKLSKGYWYKSDSANVKLNVYNNSSIYAKIWDGEKFSTNKSFQVTLPSNPYVNVNINHKLFNVYNGQYFGEEGNIINYNIDKWMSIPNISWNIYGGYETKSVVYYSNSGNEDDDYTNRRSANIDSKYTCNSNSCTFDKSKIGNNGGMQQIKIVVTNKITRKNTIIYINVNIDKKAPTLTIVNPIEDNWTKDDIKITLNYSDTHSGIDKSTIQWKDNKNNKSWQSLSYDENVGDTWSEEGDRIGYYKICDNAGNCVEEKTTIKIDKTSPKLTIDNPIGDNWTNKDITVKLKYSDEASGINKNSLEWSTDKNNWTFISNASTSNCTDTWSDNRNSKVYYRICDKVGNCTIKETTIKIDVTPPKIPEIYNPYDNKWSKGNFSLTLSSSDSYSGIAYYQYTYNKDATSTGSNHDSYWVTYSDSAKNSFVTTAFTANRNQLVYVRACDKVGNCSDKNSTYIKIDNIAPSISVTVKNNSASKSSVCKSDECSIDFNVGTWYNKKNAPIISWTISDSNETYTYFNYNSAGNYSSRSKYETKNVISTYEGTTLKSGSYEINSGGKRQVAVTVKDVAGNQTTAVIDFDLDDISPSDPTTFTISNGNIVVSGSTDKESGFDHYFYSLWNSSWTTMLASGNSGSVSLSNITSAGTYHVYAGAMDKAGNASGSPGRTISVTDKSTSSWYSCDSGTRSGAYCYHYGTVRYATSCKTCSYFSSDCRCASVNRANCPSKCRKSYNKASSCTSAGYLWNSEGYCWSYYVYGSSCSACGYTSSPYCEKGYTYSNGSCYYTTGATYHTSSSCSSGYTEYNGKCYKLS